MDVRSARRYVRLNTPSDYKEPPCDDGRDVDYESDAGYEFDVDYESDAGYESDDGYESDVDGENRDLNQLESEFHYCVLEAAQQQHFPVQPRM